MDNGKDVAFHPFHAVVLRKHLHDRVMKDRVRSRQECCRNRSDQTKIWNVSISMVFFSSSNGLSIKNHSVIIWFAGNRRRFAGSTIMDDKNFRMFAKFAPENRKGTETGSPLSQLKMSSVFYTHSIMKQPWGVKMPSIPSSTMFHLILEGEAIVSVSDEKVKLGPGDFVLLPRGTGHDIVDVNNTAAIDLFENELEQVTEHYERLRTQGQGEVTITLCGTVLFDNDVTASVISSMPEFILIPAQSRVHEAVKSIVHTIHKETKSEDYGSGLVVSKLADVLILQCIRAWIDESSEENPNWIVAHTDQRLSHVMKFIHNEPSANIEIESLAKLAGMSRTSFIEYFKKVVGQTPGKYISDWRLSLARERLLHGKAHVLNIALDVGYQSEAAFSRAYKAKYGESPSTTKKQYG